MLTSKKTILIFFTAVILLVGIFTVVQPAAAAWDLHLVPECRNNKEGCNVCDAIGVGINITKIMLGTLGSAALLMFVYGGVLMAISRGHADQVTKGKDALTNAVKGVIIVLASWVVINYGLAMMLGKTDDLKNVSLFNQNWATVDCVGSTSSNSGFDVTGPCKGMTVSQECEPGSGKVCSIKGNCVLKKCHSVYPTGYTCIDTTTRTNGKIGCEENLCGGSPSMMCCPN